MKTSAPIRLTGLALVAMSALPAVADDVAKTKFTQLDADGSGYLTRQEISTQTELSRWVQISTYGSFTLADVNSDGRVDAVEFSAFEETLPVE